MARGDIITIEQLKAMNPETNFGPAATTTATDDLNPQSSATFAASRDDNGLQAGLKSAGNVPSSAFSLGKSLFSAVTNPIDTTKGVASAVTGLGSKIQNTLGKGVDAVAGTKGFGQTGATGATQTFDAIVSSLNERYGSLEAAQKTATEDPIGVGADIVGILSGGATAGLNKVSDINSAAKASIAATTKVKFDDIAVSQMEKAIDLRPGDITKIKQPNIAGTSPAEWLLRRDFKGSSETIVDGLSDYRETTRSQVDSGLASLEGRVAAKDAQAATKMLDILEQTFSGTIGNEPLLQQLSDLKAQRDYSLTELNEIKRLADSELQIFKTNGQLKDNARSKGMANVRDEIKTLIEDKASEQGFDGVRELNKETQVSFAIEEAMRKRMDATSKLPELGLRDGIIAAGGFASGGFATAGAAIVTKKVLESTTFRTHLANKLKDAPTEQKAALQEAIDTKNYNEVLQYLIPIVNEFENSQQQSPQVQE